MASNKFDKEQIEKALELYQVLKDLRRENGYLTKEFQAQLDAVTKYLEEYEKVTNEVEKVTKKIKEQNNFLDDTEDILGSIADKVGKTTKLYKDAENYIKSQKAQLASIADYTTQIGDVEIAKSTEKAVEAYKKYQQSVAAVADRTSFTGKRQEEANIAIARARREYEESVASLANMGEEGQYVLNTLNDMANQTDKFGKAVTMTTKEWKLMDSVLDNFSGIPAMSEINTLLKTSITDTIAWKAAVFAVGAALGKLAYDAFGTSNKADLQIDKERAQTRIDGEAEIAKIQSDAAFIPQKIEQERLEAKINSENEVARLQHESLYAAQKAANSFNLSMQQGALQFQAAAKTALFGKGIGSVNYGAAQLQLAGIGAEAIAQQMSAAGNTMGKMPSSKVASDMAVMQKRTGQSAESIADLTKMFMTTEKVTDAQALNLTEGLRAMADSAKLPLDGFMQDIAEASKEMYSYNIQSGPALAKQVAFAKSLGVNFSSIAKAGRSMVTNYKDSIKAEMQLSAALGRSVDLSEVRSKFAAGDQKGAIEALKAQGLDMENMDFFAQDLLSQTFGGLDFESIRKMTAGEGANVGELKAGNAQKAGQEFLGRTQAAQAQLESQSAVLSAKQAEVDAELSAKIADAYLASKEYKEYLTKQSKASEEASNLATKMKDAWLQTDAYKKSLEESMKLDFASGLKERVYEAFATIGGGIVSILAEKALTPILSKGAGAVKGLFTKGTAESATDVASTAIEEVGGGGIKGVATDLATQGAESLIPGSGSIVEAASGQLEEAEAKIEETVSLGEKIKDFGKGMASALKDVGKGIGDFLKNTGTGIGKFLQQIGSGLGKAIGGFFSGIATGLTTFAMAMAAPTPLFGLPAGLIIVGMAMGIAKALSIAGPGIEALTPLLLGLASIIGDTFVKVLEKAGPIIKTIFDGIALVITSVGNSIASVFGAITSSIGEFAKMDALALASVAGSIGLLAGSIGLFGGANIIGAIGSFFGGGVFDDLKDISRYATPLMATAMAVESLANAFDRLSDVDVSSLNKIPWDDMEDFAKEGGHFVIAQSANKSFNITADTAKNIKTINDNLGKDGTVLKVLNQSIEYEKQIARNTEATAELIAEMIKNSGQGYKINLDGKVLNSVIGNIQQSARTTGTPAT